MSFKLSWYRKYPCRLLLLILTLAIISLAVYLVSIYPDAVDDILMNQQLTAIHLQPLKGFTPHVGLAKMKRSSVTFIGLGKNVGKKLPDFQLQIDRLSDLFQYTQGIFIIGDSTDGTLKSMVHWANTSVNRNLTILSVPSDNMVEHLPNFNGTRMPREGRIAQSRNIALGELKNHPRTDYIINIDMDVLGFNVYGIADSFGRTSKWDAVCANGILLHGIYRDLYAFRVPGINTNHHLSGLDHKLYNISDKEYRANRSMLGRSKRRVRRRMDINSVNGPTSDLLMKVDSCFGGMTIYRYDIMEGCSYTHRHPDPPYMLDCEHVLFHQCITEKHNARIVANLNMKLWYGHTTLMTVDWKRFASSLIT